MPARTVWSSDDSDRPRHRVACAGRRLARDEHRVDARQRELLGQLVLDPGAIDVGVEAVDVDHGRGGRAGVAPRGSRRGPGRATWSGASACRPRPGARGRRRRRLSRAAPRSGAHARRPRAGHRAARRAWGRPCAPGASHSSARQGSDHDAQARRHRAACRALCQNRPRDRNGSPTTTAEPRSDPWDPMDSTPAGGRAVTRARSAPAAHRTGGAAVRGARRRPEPGYPRGAWVATGPRASRT